MEEKIRRNEEVVWNIVDGEAVLLNPETGSYYGLNKTAAEIWKCLETPQNRQKLVDFLVSRFDASVELITSNIETLLVDMKIRKLIIVEED